VKELKATIRADHERRLLLVWNPVKELKVAPNPVPLDVVHVESGEGIESCLLSAVRRAKCNVESGEGIESLASSHYPI